MGTDKRQCLLVCPGLPRIIPLTQKPSRIDRASEQEISANKRRGEDSNPRCRLHGTTASDTPDPSSNARDLDATAPLSYWNPNSGGNTITTRAAQMA